MGSGSSLRKRQERDEELKATKMRTERALKVLALGTHASGKSTFSRNVTLMDALTNGTLDLKQWKEDNKAVVKQYTWRTLQLIVLHFKTVNGMGISADNLSKIKNFWRYECNDVVTETKNIATMLYWLRAPHFADALQMAKLDPTTAAQMINAEYFIQSAPFILSADYQLPSVGDVLRMSERTRGHIYHDIDICPEGSRTKTLLDFVEVGGRLCQRKKWLYCLEDTECVLFFLDVMDCVRASVLFEDYSMDRWKDSMELLRDILNRRYFESTLFRILLTKCDCLFATYASDEMLNVSKIRDSDETPPPMTATECLRYLKQQLPMFCTDTEMRENRVSVEAVNCVPLRMEALFDLATIHGFVAGDSVETVLAKERKRRTHLVTGATKQWTVALPIWERLDTSDLRRLIEAFAFRNLGESLTDSRLKALKEPWQVLAEVTTDLLLR